MVLSIDDRNGTRTEVEEVSGRNDEKPREGQAISEDCAALCVGELCTVYRGVVLGKGGIIEKNILTLEPQDTGLS